MPQAKYYIGLAASHHDPALAIVNSAGEVVFAEAAERYLQDKRAYNAPPDHFLRTPELIQEYCGMDAELVVAVSWSKAWTLENRLMVSAANLFSGIKPLQDLWDQQTSEALWPGPKYKNSLTALMHSVSQAANNLTGIKQLSHPATVRYYDHHLAHAASACYTSPFADCVCAVIDGFGEWRSCDFFHYQQGQLTPLRTGLQNRRDSGSLGFFYALICSLCGFDPMKGEEWKVMGLASYGQYDEQLYQLLRPMLQVQDLSLQFPRTNYQTRMQALQAVRRQPGASPLAVANLAYTGQYIFEEVMQELLTNLYRHQPSPHLSLAGGCVLNSSWNGQITQRTNFHQAYIPSAPGDDGTAIGAALLAYHADHPDRQVKPRRLSPYLGSSMAEERLNNLKKFGKLSKAHAAADQLYAQVAEQLAAGKIVGWIQGRAEFGPRALGHRSILADPRAADMAEKINERVKFRERFRPFAPSILPEFGDHYFEHYQASPYMERTLRFKPEVRTQVAAVVHVDGTGRLQTVEREWSEAYYRLLEEFYRLTDVPLLLNTSFNVMGKPIVHSVEDAISVFYTSGLDLLVIGDYIIEK